MRPLPQSSQDQAFTDWTQQQNSQKFQTPANRIFHGKPEFFQHPTAPPHARLDCPGGKLLIYCASEQNSVARQRRLKRSRSYNVLSSLRQRQGGLLRLHNVVSAVSQLCQSPGRKASSHRLPLRLPDYGRIGILHTTSWETDVQGVQIPTHKRTRLDNKRYEAGKTTILPLY